MSRRTAWITGTIAFATIFTLTTLAVRQVLIDEGLIHWNGSRIARSKATGQEIIGALRSYKQAHGSYPDALDALVDDHIAKIRSPVAGTKEWTYRLLDSGEFELQFGSGQHQYPCVYFESSRWDWYHDQ